MNLPLQTPASTRAWRALVLAVALAAGVATGLRSESNAAALKSVAIDVVDLWGKPIEKAVVWAVPLSGQPLPATAGMSAEIRQLDARFIPEVTPVRVGTAVSFPNLDNVRHNVYSFSPAKQFSISLYLGTPAEPVVFDRPGEVVIGCNIHDRMVAYVLALDTPYFDITGRDGGVQLAGLVPGDYELHAWHPDQRTEPPPRRVTVGAQDRLAHRFVADLTPRWQTPSGE
jgi:plastocyanin